jgi:hypothetical protein
MSERSERIREVSQRAKRTAERSEAGALSERSERIREVSNRAKRPAERSEAMR